METMYCGFNFIVHLSPITYLECCSTFGLADDIRAWVIPKVWITKWTEADLLFLLGS